MKLCRCGCGTPVSGKWNAHTQRVVEYVAGHNARGKAKSVETRRRMSEAMYGNKNGVGPRPSTWKAQTAKAGHHFLSLHHPKSGVCEECGETGRTDYAFLHHPEPHTRNRADYRELCRRCHTQMDVASGHRPDWTNAERNPRVETT